MEAMRDAALAHYETLADEEKLKIHKEFETVEDDGMSEYIKSLSLVKRQIAKQCLGERHNKEEGSVELKEFITLKYILKNKSVVRCNGCSSFLMGRAFFSCEECFFNYRSRSYDLCSNCYGARKFENHNHSNFLDNQHLQSLSRRRFARMMRWQEERNKGVEEAIEKLSCAFTEFSRSVRPNSWVDDGKAISDEVKEDNNNNNSTQNFGGNSNPPWLLRSTVVGIPPQLDLFGVEPTLSDSDNDN